MEQRSIDHRRLYYENGMLTEFDAVVKSCKAAKNGFAVTLDRTAFFPGGGGQEADTGEINGTRLLSVFEEEGEVVHLLPAELSEGMGVSCRIDRIPRLRKMQGHGGEHILSGIMHRLFGTVNAGFHLGKNEIVTVDTRTPVTDGQLRQAEAEANLAIAENIPINAYFPTPKELEAMTFRSKIDFEGEVRIVEIEGIDVCACCAPHFASTGSIGSVKILEAIPWKGGTRITLVCGLAAFEDHVEKHDSVKRISVTLSAKTDEVAEAVENRLEKAEEAKKSVAALSRAMRDIRIENTAAAEKCLCIFDEYADAEGLRDYANRLAEKCAVAAAFAPAKTGFTYAAASKKHNMRTLAPVINSALGGKGGGSETMIFGSVTAEKEAVESFFKTLEP
ncbi:MAG: alanyl-tRNA editing protein [Ruminococcaceae bacterium]|nr:alanyl-tRNA editing protein [Oscillospiraceae bacterium]